MRDAGDPDPGVEWMIALGQGDRSAFERIVEHYQELVLNLIFKFMGTRNQAEDLAQEVFIRAMAHRPEKPRAWIFAVAANLARDEARAAIRRKRHLTLLTNDPVTLNSPSESAHETVEHDEQMAQVQLALDALTPRDREVLLLWDAGLSYQEIAKQTGLAVGAVGTTLARARKRLVEAHDRMEAEDRAAHS